MLSSQGTSQNKSMKKNSFIVISTCLAVKSVIQCIQCCISPINSNDKKKNAPTEYSRRAERFLFISCIFFSSSDASGGNEYTKEETISNMQRTALSCWVFFIRQLVAMIQFKETKNEYTPVVDIKKWQVTTTFFLLFFFYNSIYPSEQCYISFERGQNKK